MIPVHNKIDYTVACLRSPRQFVTLGTAASPPEAGTSLSVIVPILMGGSEWPKFRNAPLEHIGPKVPVVTTSIPVQLPKERNEIRETKPENITISVDEQGRIRLSKSGAEEAAERKEAADYMRSVAPRGSGKGFGTLGDLLRQKLEKK